MQHARFNESKRNNDSVAALTITNYAALAKKNRNRRTRPRLSGVVHSVIRSVVSLFKFSPRLYTKSYINVEKRILAQVR